MGMDKSNLFEDNATRGIYMKGILTSGPLFNYSAALSKVLTIPNTTDGIDNFQDRFTFGCHIFDTSIILIDEIFVNNIQNAKDEMERNINTAFAIGIIAHEKKHFHQNIKEKSKYLSDFLAETRFFNKDGTVTKEEYLNLNAEIDARAFAALIEERLIGREILDLPAELDKEKFETRKEELKKLFGEKINIFIKPIITY